MITKDLLKEYENNKKNYKYEINKIQNDIYNARKNTAIDSVNGSRREFPYIQSHVVIEGINNSKIKRLEHRKKKFKRDLEKLEKSFKYELDTLEDRVVADIIERKYIKEQSWNKIAMDMNYAGESSVRNTVDRFLKK